MLDQALSWILDVSSTTRILVAIILVLVTAYYWLLPSHDKRYPPCPAPILPVVGNLLSMDPNLRTLFGKWKQEVGDIFSLHLGGTMMVVLNNYRLIKECLVKNSQATSDRPFMFMTENANLGGKGLIFTSGQVWKEHRTLSLAVLRAFGMGRNILAEKTQEEVSFFLESLSDLKGKPTDISMLTLTYISNIICSILLGQRFDMNDQRFQELIDRMVRNADLIAGTNILNVFPRLAQLPGDVFKAKEMREHFRFFMDFFLEYIEKTKKEMEEKGYNAANIVIQDIEDEPDTLEFFGDDEFDSKDILKTKQVHESDEEQEKSTHNYISIYLAERKKRLKAGTATTLDDESLAVSCFELFASGTDTSASTILWCLLYILHNPYVQDKIHAEIDTVFNDSSDPDMLPSMTHRKSLVYLQAAIMESQRLGSILPLSNIHYCNKDIEVDGFLIPEGARIAPNIDAIHYSPEVWGPDVQDFRPERFLDDQGNLIRREDFIPFGIGKRSCLGEPLARMEMFLFLAGLFKRFEVLPADENNLPRLDPVLGLVYSPHHFSIRIVERKMKSEPF